MNVRNLMIILIAFALVTVGCTNSVPVQNESMSQGAVTQTEVVAETKPEEKEEEPATKEIIQTKPLVVYANDFTDYIGDMFEAETGFKVETVQGGGAVTLSRIEAERGNPQWDVVWIDGHGSIFGLGERDFLLDGWEPENLSHLSEAGKAFLPEKLNYFPTGIHAAGVIIYNTNYVTADQAPQTWEEFMNFNGPIGMADPGVAAPAYPLVSQLFKQWGVDESKKLFEQRFKEKQFYVYPKNPPVAQALMSGEIHVAALQEHNAYGLKLNGEPVEIIWPEEGALGSVRVAAISKESDNIEIAKLFIEFLLDPKTQEALTNIDDTDSFFSPYALGATPREERKANALLHAPDAQWSSEHEADIKQWFADQSVQ